MTTFNKKTLVVSVLLILSNTLATTATATTDNVVELKAVEVTAQIKESGNGPVYGVAPSQTATGMGFDTKIQNIPQSVSVIGNKEIKKIGATDVKQALSYTPGVVISSPRDKTSEQVYIRSFDSNGESLTNGQKQKSEIWTGTTEMYGLERIEVLKGSSAVLYGEGSPGGVINKVTKQPVFTDFASTTLTLGSPQHVQVATDVNKKINDAVAVRGIALFKDSETTTDNVPDDRMYTSANMKIVVDKTKVNTRLEYQKDHTAYPWGLPVKGTLQSSKWGKIDPNTYLGNPKTDHYKKENITAAVDVDHQLTDTSSLKVGVSNYSADIDFDYIGLAAGGGVRDDRFYKVDMIKRDEKNNTLATNAKLNFDWGNKDIKNKTLLGLDFTNNDYTVDASNALSFGEVDIYNPDYSKVAKPKMQKAMWSSDKNMKNLGVLVQQQTTLQDTWVATYGARYDKLSSELKYPAFGAQFDQEFDNVSGRAGVVYLGNNGVSPYVSYSESFQPVIAQSDPTKEPLSPMYGKLLEAGVKYAPKKSDTLLTASVYKISENNVAIVDPTSPYGFNVQIPQIDAKGLELEAKTKIGSNATLTAGYSYNDTNISDTGNLTFVKKGDSKPQTPKHTASIFATSNLSAFDMPEIEAGLGAKFVGKASTNYPEMSPKYAVIDGVINYQKDDWKLSLNANNLFDNKYIDKCSKHCFYGPSREVRASLTYHH